MIGSQANINKVQEILKWLPDMAEAFSICPDPIDRHHIAGDVRRRLRGLTALERAALEKRVPGFKEMEDMKKLRGEAVRKIRGAAPEVMI